ncbi:Hpt domain-containing protein [Maritalea sp.]|uniref:Hpt domain-containing protein n=1 Tax=Maritalea sp. TaxID=2003361 RepID=UPI003EF80441
MASATAFAPHAQNNINEYGQERLIDLVYLARQTMGSKSLEIEILRLFKTQLEIHLDSFAESEDDGQLRMRLHTIKGASGGVGAFEIGQLAATAEAYLIKGEEIPDGQIDGLRQGIQSTVIYINQLLAD